MSSTIDLSNQLNQTLQIIGNGGVQMPFGATSHRPNTPMPGTLRWNINYAPRYQNDDDQAAVLAYEPRLEWYSDKIRVNDDDGNFVEYKSGWVAALDDHSAVNLFVRKKGDKMSGDLVMVDNLKGIRARVTGLPDPREGDVGKEDAVSRDYADRTYVNAVGDTMTGHLRMTSEDARTGEASTVYGLPWPRGFETPLTRSIDEGDSDAIPKDFAETQYLHVKGTEVGDYMEGELDMNEEHKFRIINLGDARLNPPLDFSNYESQEGDFDAVNVRTLLTIGDDRYVRKIGDTMTGALVMRIPEYVDKVAGWPGTLRVAENVSVRTPVEPSPLNAHFVSHRPTADYAGGIGFGSGGLERGFMGLLPKSEDIQITGTRRPEFKNSLILDFDRIKMTGTGSVQIPVGADDKKEPATPKIEDNGSIRYDTTTNRYQVVQNGKWTYLMTEEDVKNNPVLNQVIDQRATAIANQLIEQRLANLDVIARAGIGVQRPGGPLVDSLPLTDDVELALRNSGVAPGTYGNTKTIPQITVDAWGRVTSIVNKAVDFPDGEPTGGGDPGSSTFDPNAIGTILAIGETDQPFGLNYTGVRQLAGPVSYQDPTLYKLDGSIGVMPNLVYWYGTQLKGYWRLIGGWDSYYPGTVFGHDHDQYDTPSRRLKIYLFRKVKN